MDSASCRECAGTSFVQTVSDVVCQDCGIVIDSVTFDRSLGFLTSSWDNGKEYAKEGQQRPGLYTSMFPGKSDEFAERPSKRSRLIDGRGTPGADKVMLKAEQFATQLCEKIQLGSNILETAKSYIRLIHLPGTVKVQRQNVLTTACVFHACKQNGVPRTLKEMANYTDVSCRRLNKAVNDTGIVLDVKMGGTSSVGTSTAECLIGRCVNSLDLPESATISKRQIAATARLLFSKRITHNLQGKTPNTVAGTYIMAALRTLGLEKDITVDDVSVASGVTPFTLRKTFATIATLL